MSLKQSEAQRRRWSNVKPADRSEIGRTLAIKKAASMSVAEKRKHAMMMVKARSKNK